MSDHIETVGDIASQTVRDRQSVYGSPVDDFMRTATMWSAILGIPVRAEQVAACMIAVKLSRLVQTPGHKDSLIDVCGYAICWEEIANAKEKTQLAGNRHIDPDWAGRRTFDPNDRISPVQSERGLYK